MRQKIRKEVELPSLKNKEKGQMLAEILVAVIIAAIIIGGISTTVGTSVITGDKVRQMTSAITVIQETIEGVKVITESGWIDLYCLPSGTCPGTKGTSNHYFLNYINGRWQIQAGENHRIMDNIDYTFYFIVENVNRDALGNIVSSGGTEDPSTKKITATVNWDPNNSISMVEYLMRTTSSYFSDYNWNINRISSGIFTNSQGYYAATSGAILISNGTISLNPSIGSGSLTSPIFDTTFSKGVAFNGISWKGNLPAGSRVRFQLASSNTTTTWNFIGPDGTAATYYETAGPNQVVTVNLLNHNNHRYFRYKVYLDPTADGLGVPIAYKIIFTYSP